jgi:flagellar basal-body rod protein FlgF
VQPVEAAAVSVRAGFLEGSNVSAMSEMANLISVMRSFEANQRTMQIHNERLGRTISELGNPS